MADQILTPEITSVLLRATIIGNKLIVPNNPDGSLLERSLYTKVNNALMTLGGKWNKKEKGHIFDGDPREKLGLMLETGVAVDKKKKLQAFYTPANLADEIAEAASVEGQVVLEPSAGHGALVKACERAGAEKVVCVEIDPESAAKLKADGADVTCADFLTLAPDKKYGRIVMNPPFTRGQDLKHIERALKWLAPNGILVSVTLPNHDRTKLEKMFGKYRWESWEVEAGAFKQSGTNIKTAILRLEAVE